MREAALHWEQQPAAVGGSGGCLHGEHGAVAPLVPFVQRSRPSDNPMSCVRLRLIPVRVSKKGQSQVHGEAGLLLLGAAANSRQEGGLGLEPASARASQHEAASVVEANVPCQMLAAGHK